MIYLIIIIVIFLSVLSLISKYVPIFTTSRLEKKFIKYKIKYPNVFVIA